MSEQLNSVQQASSPKYLSLPWFITLVAAFCVLVLVAGTVAEEAGKWLSWDLIVASVIFVVAWIVTYKYANPKLPLIWGVLMGVMALDHQMCGFDRSLEKGGARQLILPLQ